MVSISRGYLAEDGEKEDNISASTGTGGALLSPYNYYYFIFIPSIVGRDNLSMFSSESPKANGGGGGSDSVATVCVLRLARRRHNLDPRRDLERTTRLFEGGAAATIWNTVPAPHPQHQPVQEESPTMQRFLARNAIRRKAMMKIPSWSSFVVVALLLCLNSIISCGNALSTSSKATPRHRPVVQRVAVIGSGIAGLSVAHALTNSPQLGKEFQQIAAGAQPEPFDVSIYDSRPALDSTAGAGVQLNGGLAVLGMINPIVQQAVIKAGLPQVGVQSRCKSWSKEGSNDDFDTLLQLDLPKTVERGVAGGDVSQNPLLLLANENAEGGDSTRQLLWVSIMRGALQEALYDALPKTTRQNVHFSKSLIGIQPSDDNIGVFCTFSDGSKEGPFDVVVGCDGIKSPCKEFIETGQISSRTSARKGALYSGLRIKYAVQDAVQDGLEDDKVPEPVSLTQYFGDGGYALDGIYGAGPGRPKTRCGFLIYLDDKYIGPFQRKRKIHPASSSLASVANEDYDDENADWSQDVSKEPQDERSEMMSKVKAYGIPTSLGVGPTIANADRFFELGVYYHNPFSLSGWSKEVPNSNGSMVVLCGDAAHALPPFLGQGSNQAIQDAFCLAKKLYEFNALQQDPHQSEKNKVDTLPLMLKEYEKTRWPSTFNIFWKAAFLGYLETGGVNGFYSKFRDIFFKTMGVVGVAERVLLSAALPKV